MLKRSQFGTGPEKAPTTEGRFTLHLAEAHIRDSAVEADTGCRQESRICLLPRFCLEQTGFEARRLGHTLAHAKKT